MKIKIKLIKISLLILTIFLFTILLNNKVFAFGDLTATIEDPSQTLPEQKIIEIANPILTLIQIGAIGAAIGLIIFDGIKLLTTSDNSEKANLKRKIIYYFIGGILIFIPATIIKILAESSSMII